MVQRSLLYFKAENLSATNARVNASLLHRSVNYTPKYFITVLEEKAMLQLLFLFSLLKREP
jgi:hypothetical protein